ncbi:SpoIIE family protein phosphatase [Streptomyces sp. H10-C2]|uniref:SpoIIE family protein phosphatase n=1 Tax=unclassified Streptomyces TaxID=2593676 RepID=UPI0024BA8FFF|nr:MULTISPECIES: SpoIIE family protein phosphatase [unclassified Streptomyces]MDJ0343427.1 SpoIIE family protein phosphatase [Streptomyces sp. PH10-H1]MDJ0371507.1 SpoIIE family protein phosphatase [Streptomyces sp. H10-C2]
MHIDRHIDGPTTGADAGRVAAGGEALPRGLLFIPIATALIQDDGRIIHWSADAEVLLGYTAGEAVGAYASQLLVDADQRPRVLSLFADILAGQSWSGVFPVKHRDGHSVNLEFRTHPILGGSGRPLVLAVASDVRAIRRIESDLAVLDSFFTQSPVGMAVYDSDLRFVRLNEALARINGVSAEQHLGRRMIEVLPGLNGAEIEAVMRHVLETGEPVVDARSHGITPADPTMERAWSASYFRLEEPAGRILGVSSTIIEVTARFQAESRAAKARERLELLVDATSRIGTTLELGQTARELADTMVPRLADVSGVFILERLLTGQGVEPADPQGAERVCRLAIASSDPDYPVQDLPVGAVHSVPPSSPYAKAMASGRTVVVPSRDLLPLATGLSADRVQAYQGRVSRTVRVTPLVVRETVLGMVVYSRRDGPEAFGQEDITLADELTSRAAVAIDNALLYRREHETGLARQQALQETNAARERLALVNEASARIGTTLDLAQTALELAEVATPGLADAVVVEVVDALVRGEEDPGPPDRSALLRRLAFHTVDGAKMWPAAPVGDVHRFHPGTPYAWCLAHRRPVLVPRMDEQGLSWFADDPARKAAVREQGVRSFMVVPLIARGAAVGVVSFYRTVTDRPYGKEDLALAGELAARAAVSIDNALLYTRERDASKARQQALEEAHAAQERLALLNDASSRIGTTLDLQRTAEELVELVIPRFADFVTVDLLDSVVQGGEEEGEQAPTPTDGTVVLRAVAVGEVTEAGMVGAADEVGGTSRSAKLYAESLRTGRSILVAQVDEAALHRIVADPDRIRPSLDAGVHSYLMVPLLARGVVLGGAEFIRMRNPEPFTVADVALAEELAARAAVCIDNARLYRRERDTALTLQRSLLPQEVHRTPGLEIAYRYLPSSVVSEVGGDWFDVVPLSCGRVALVVGDVMGHGIRAAATMGQLRTAARTLITLDLSPDRVLRRLDETASAIGDGQFTTCVCAVFDPVDRSCTIACAGHPPPVVQDPNGSTRLLDLPSGAPLGVGGVAFESVEFTLPEDGVLVLYTDGLIERRDRDLDEGMRLLSRVVAKRGPSLEESCDAVLDALSAKDSEDDIAIIMARALPVRDDWIATLALSGDMAMVGQARRFTRATLTSWGLPSLCEVSELLVSELVSNALLHTGMPTELRLFRDRVLTLEVADTDSHAPRLRRVSENDEGGRGMYLVNKLAHRWGSRTTHQGKVVWLELELPLGTFAPPGP